jgi:hypothetical protein
MQTFNGSMKFDMHGRRRKTNVWKTRSPARQAVFKPLEASPNVPRDDHREKYPSKSDMSTRYSSGLDTSFRVEESKKFTVAPAYNKGAYQVISQLDVKHIGR